MTLSERKDTTMNDIDRTKHTTTPITPAAWMPRGSVARDGQRFSDGFSFATDAHHGVAVTLHFDLPAEAGAKLVSEGQRRQTALRRRIEERVRETSEYAELQQVEEQSRDIEKECKRLARRLEDAGERRRDLATDLQLGGVEKAMRLTELQKEEAGAREELTALDASGPDMQGEIARRKAALLDVARRIAAEQMRTAVEEASAKERDLLGIAGKIAADLSELVCSGVFSAGIRGPHWSDRTAEAIVGTLADPLPRPASPPSAPPPPVSAPYAPPPDPTAEALRAAAAAAGGASGKME